MTTLSHRPLAVRKPFLKWAGGKTRVLGRILTALPQGKRLVEPFVGSAAVYLNADFPSALLCDVNADLVGLYACLQAEGREFMAYCAQYFLPENNRPEAYLRLRGVFNEARRPRDGDLASAPERAALFLYLNRHCYNGLARYNAKGAFNVPFGRHKAPRFPERELDLFLEKMRRTETRFAVMDFRETFRSLKAGDVVYADPPYAPLSSTAEFTTYAGNVFGPEDQADLANLAARAAAKGVPVILSNHDIPFTRGLYHGARLETFQVRRYISCRGAERRPAPELLAVFEETHEDPIPASATAKAC